MNFWTLLLKLAINYVKSYISISKILGINPNVLKDWLVKKPQKLQQAIKALSTPRKIKLNAVLKQLISKKVIDTADLIWEAKNGKLETSINKLGDIVIKTIPKGRKTALASKGKTRTIAVGSRIFKLPVLKDVKRVVDKTSKAIDVAKTQIETENAQEVEFRVLSSGWIVSGHWVPNDDNNVVENGALTITTKTGGTYTYYQVPIRTWALMKLARGKNGSGAGTEFWRGYLHRYQSRIKTLQLKEIKQQALAFKKQGIPNYDPNLLAIRRNIIKQVRQQREVFRP